MSGRKNESENDRWLLARIAPPDAGTFSSPLTQGRNSALRTGPSTILLSSQ